MLRLNIAAAFIVLKYTKNLVVKKNISGNRSDGPHEYEKDSVSHSNFRIDCYGKKFFTLPQVVVSFAAGLTDMGSLPP